MQEPAFGKIDVGTSQFYMIRCVIAMAHADGMVCPEENSYIDGLIRRMPFNDEQRTILRNDLDTPQEVDGLLAYINEPKFRSQVLYFCRLLAFKDGNLHPNEDDLLKHLHIKTQSSLDMESIRASAREETQRQVAQHDIELDSNRPNKGLSGLLDRFMIFCGLDLTEE